MDRDRLEAYLSEGLSLNQIGEIVGRPAGTVGYWVAKYGLVANGKQKHAPRGGLTREQLEPLVQNGATLQEMADELGRSTSTVRHWLLKFGLNTRNRVGPRPGNPRRRDQFEAAVRDGLSAVVLTCERHGETEFAVIPSQRRVQCKRCRSEAVAEWRRRVKLRLIEEFGGCCQLCGYDRCPPALQFHHIDPSMKEFNVSRQGITRAYAEVHAEARKCILLCGNCHAEVQAGFRELEDFDQLTMRI